MSNSVRPHRRQPTSLPHPWDSPCKNTGVGCHFLLQCMKVKSESEVKLLSRIRLLATPWTVAYQAPPSMGFSRQEYRSGVPLPSPNVFVGIIKLKKKFVNCLPRQRCNFTFPLAMYQSSSFPTFLSTLGIVSLLNLGHCCHLSSVKK